MKLSAFLKNILTVIAIGIVLGLIIWAKIALDQNRMLREMIKRLSADTRIAEVVVTKSELDEVSGKVLTTIKFLEYDTQGLALTPKYFTFRGNMIQFQSLVIRFNDDFVEKGDRLRGKSVYLFMKAFVLDPKDLQVFDITQTGSVPVGYQTDANISGFERSLWKKFWGYALDPKVRGQMGIKNAQIEAPGSLFLPGTIYTLTIEHDGGIRIDTRPVPEILKGEKVA